MLLFVDALDTGWRAIAPLFSVRGMWLSPGRRSWMWIVVVAFCSPTRAAEVAAPCVMALPKLTAAGRATVTSKCGSHDGRIHDGDNISLGARGHVRLEAPLDEGSELDVTCIASAPVALTVAGNEPPWLASGDVTCTAWTNNERTCKTATGDEVLVCGAQARKSNRPIAATARPLGLPSWYVGNVVDVSPTDVVEPAAAAPSVEAPRKRNMRIAVYELKASGVDERVALVTTASLTAELRKLNGVTVIGMDEVRAMLDLEAEKQLLGCPDDSCLAEIAESLGADTLVVGSLAHIGEENVIGIKRIDQRAASVAGQVNQRLKPANGEEFLAAIGPAVEALFGDFSLKPGKTRGVPEELALRLNPPPLPTWSFYTALGVTGGAALVAGLATAVYQIDNGAYEKLRVPGELRNSEYEQAKGRAVSSEMLMWTAWGVTAALAVGAGVMAGFTDFAGSADDLTVGVQ
jgi:hypothetical protein